MTVDFLINIFLNIVRKQKKRLYTKRKEKKEKRNPLLMAKHQLTMLKAEHFAVVLNSFHTYYEIADLMLDIDDDGDNQSMTYKHCMLMGQTSMMGLLLIQTYHLILYHTVKMLEMMMLLVGHREIFRLEQVMEQVHVEWVVELGEVKNYLDQNKDLYKRKPILKNFLV